MPYDEYDVIGQDIRSRLEALEGVLFNYRKLSGNGIKLADLIGETDNRLLTTRTELVRDAALRTETLNGRDRETHLAAKEALLLWCMIYCEKILARKYHSQRWEITDAIHDSTVKGTQACLTVIRDNNVAYFLNDPERRQFDLENYSVKECMARFATRKMYTELEEIYHRKLVEISANKAEELKSKGKPVIESRGRFYTPRNDAITLIGNDGEEYLHPEVADIIIEDIVCGAIEESAIDEYLPYIIKQAKFSIEKEEFLRRVIRNGEPAAAVFNEWKAKGKKVPSNSTRYKHEILARIQEVIINDRKLNELWGDMLPRNSNRQDR